MRESPRRSAQRPLPSMMIATCRAVRSASSANFARSPGVWLGAGGDRAALANVTVSGGDPALPSSFRVGTAAQVTVAAAGLAAAEIWRQRTGRAQGVSVDMRQAAIEFRSDDAQTAEAIAPLNHPETAICVTAERAFLTRLEGSCRTPIAGLATLDGGTLKFRGMVFSVDGERAFEIERDGPAESAASLGIGAADTLLEMGAEVLLAPTT